LNKADEKQQQLFQTGTNARQFASTNLPCDCQDQKFVWNINVSAVVFQPKEALVEKSVKIQFNHLATKSQSRIIEEHRVNAKTGKGFKSMRLFLFGCKADFQTITNVGWIA